MYRAVSRSAAVAGLFAAAVVVVPSPEAGAQDARSIWRELLSEGGDAYQEGIFLATGAADRGDWVQAIQYCEQSVAIDSSRVEGHACVLRSLFFAGRYADLHGRFAQVAAEQPSAAASVQVAHYVAMALASEGRFGEAANRIRAATRYRSSTRTSAIHYTNLGELYAASGDLDTAALFFRQAIAANGRYLLARLGLAAVLTRLGDDEAARLELVHVVLEDPALTVFDMPGLFSVPEGELLFWRALATRAAGRDSEAHELLEQFAETASGQATRDVVARLLGEAPTGVGTIERVRIAGCRPMNIALAPNRSRVAVACESGGIREGVLVNGVATLTELTTEFAACCTWGSPVSSYLSDMAYSPAGDALRLLYTDGQSEQRPVGTSSVTPQLFASASYDTRAISFVGDGSRVLIASQMSAGAYVGDWGAPQLLTSAVSTSNGIWVGIAHATQDGRYVAVVDGLSAHVFAAQSAQLLHRATIPVSTSWVYGTIAALSSDGQQVLVGRENTLVTYSVSPMRVLSFVSLDTTPRLANDTWSSSVSFLESIGPTEYVVGTFETIHIYNAAGAE